VQIIRDTGYFSDVEEIPLSMADGRVLAEPITISVDIPGFDRALKDGYALLSKDTQEATPKSPVVLRVCGMIPMGYGETPVLKVKEAFGVSTGGRIPKGADAVVMHEAASFNETSGTITITHAVSPHSNIVHKGEDFASGDEIFPKGWTVRIQDIGVLAAVGKTRVNVLKTPVVGIISTGREIISAELEPRDGEVREVNSHLISGFLRRQGVVPRVYGIIKDEPELLSILLHQAAHVCDMVIVSGGSSKSAHDLTNEIICHLGEPDAPGIMVGPGRPTLVRFVYGTPVIALPGHPTSAFLILVLGISQLLQGLKGSPCQKHYKQTVQMAVPLPSHADRDQYFPVSIQNGIATPIGGVSGSFSTLLNSDGIVHVPIGKSSLAPGEEVEVIVW
jgi:molybdopterin molybdotransferase